MNGSPRQERYLDKFGNQVIEAYFSGLEEGQVARRSIQIKPPSAFAETEVEAAEPKEVALDLRKHFLGEIRGAIRVDRIAPVAVVGDRVVYSNMDRVETLAAGTRRAIQLSLLRVSLVRSRTLGGKRK